LVIFLVLPDVAYVRSRLIPIGLKDFESRLFYHKRFFLKAARNCNNGVSFQPQRLLELRALLGRLAAGEILLIVGAIFILFNAFKWPLAAFRIPL
jgi:hypothetical protein